MLEEGAVDLAIRKPSFGTTFVVNRGENISIRPDIADLNEDPFGPTKVEQEVVNQRDARHACGAV